PNFKKDLARLTPFLKRLGKRTKAAFEFRHDSWFDDEVAACLRAHAIALAFADTDDKPVDALTGTTDWGYVRLRQTHYTDAQLRNWVEKIKSRDWKTAYVFFMHEETGTGPRFAARFREL